MYKPNPNDGTKIHSTTTSRFAPLIISSFFLFLDNSRVDPVPRHPLCLAHQLLQRVEDLCEGGVSVLVLEGEVEVLLELALDLLALLGHPLRPAVLECVEDGKVARLL